MTAFIVEEIHLGWSYAPWCQISIQEKKNLLPQFSADAYLNNAGVRPFPRPRAHSDFPEGWSLTKLGRSEILCPGLPSTCWHCSSPASCRHGFQKTLHGILNLTSPGQTDATRP